MTAPKAIETPRLILRPWQGHDLAPYAEICADPEVMKYVADGKPRTPEQSADAIRFFEGEWHTRGYGVFAVELKETDQLMGFAGFLYPDFLPQVLPSVEIGWRFGRPFWGRGYATEAAQAALDYGLNDRGLTDIVSIFHLENKASERVMQKIGLRFDQFTTEPVTEQTVGVYRLPAPG